MFGKILKYGSLSIIAGGYIYISQFNKLKLNNPFVRSGLKYLDRQSPEYAMMFFKMLMKIDVLGRDGELGKYVLQAGFDGNAHYLKQLERIGFKGVEIGPVSLNPSLNEEKQNHLGIIYTLANICAFKNQKKISNFLIYLNIAPNEQILKYAPYILDDNILEAINRFVEIQGKMDVGLIDKIRVSFDKNGYQIQSLQIKQTKKMIEKVEKLSKEYIFQINKAKNLHIEINFKKEKEQNYIKWGQLLNRIIDNKLQ